MKICHKHRQVFLLDGEFVCLWVNIPVRRIQQIGDWVVCKSICTCKDEKIKSCKLSHNCYFGVPLLCSRCRRAVLYELLLRYKSAWNGLRIAHVETDIRQCISHWISPRVKYQSFFLIWCRVDFLDVSEQSTPLYVLYYILKTTSISSIWTTQTLFRPLMRDVIHSPRLIASNNVHMVACDKASASLMSWLDVINIIASVRRHGTLFSWDMTTLPLHWHDWYVQRATS